MNISSVAVEELVQEEARQIYRARWGGYLLWGFMFLMVLYWSLLYFLGDQWWPVTILLYAPRWPSIIPLIGLILYRGKITRWLFVPIAISLWLIVFVLMGFQVSVGQILPNKMEDQTRLRLVTWNAMGGKFKAQPWEEYLLKVNPDVVVCQEWPTTSPRPQHWQFDWNVEEQNNAMLLATRFELSKVSSITAKELGANGFVAAYELNTSLGPVSIINVHLPTIRGQSGELEELIQGLPGSVDNFIKVLERRRDAVEKMKAWITTVPGPCILAGDFNMTSDDGLYRKSWKGYGNAFEKAGWGFGYTKWTSWHGVRIDHVLFEQTWQCIHAEVGPNLGSDHRPLYVELIPAGVN